MLFEDSTGRRAALWKAFVALVVIGIPLWIGDFVYRVSHLSAPTRNLEIASGQKDVPLSNLANGNWTERRLAPLAAPDCQSNRDGFRKVLGYLPAQDPRALSGFWQHCAALDAVLVESFEFDTRDQSLTALGDDPFGANDTGTLPEILLTVAPRPTTSENSLEPLIADDAGRAQMLSAIKAATQNRSYAGLCLDLTAFPTLATDGLVALVRDMAALREGVPTSTCIIAGPEAALWRRPDLTAALDTSVVLGFDPVRPTFAPIAPPDWFSTAMSKVTSVLPVRSQAVALASFGDHWRTGSAAVQTVSYAQALWLANQFDGTIGSTTGSGSTYIQFLDQDRMQNRIWLADAVALFNQLRQLDANQTIVVWPLGYEDPAIWPVLSADIGSVDAQSTLTGDIGLTDSLMQTGQGAVVTAIADGITGTREVQFDASGRAVWQSYPVLPSPVTLRSSEQSGAGLAMVTFGGLSPEVDLVALLDILRDNKISATFFLSDVDILRLGETINLIPENGHVIGAKVKSNALKAPLEAPYEALLNNGSQQVLAHLTGHRATPIRSPDRRLELPQTAVELDLTAAFVTDNLIPVSSGATLQNPETDRARFIAQLRDASLAGKPAVMTFDLTTPHAALLVATLPDLFDELRRDGFSLASLADVSGLTQRDLAPPDSASVKARDGVTFGILTFWHFGLTITFLVLLVFAMVRSTIYLTLAFVRKPAPLRDPAYLPGVTVLVPAYNEANVIVRSIWSILGSDYPNFEIIVIDDGSTDNTYETIDAEFHDHPQVRVLRQENGGKWRAANHALPHIRAPLFVGVDADTILDPGALGWLVQHFKDERVGAVAGFVEVGNRKNFLTACQALEYLVSQAVARRSFETFDGIFVVPGAIGAWRVTAVNAAKAYSGDTITEDADLTVAIHRAGYKVRFQEQARAYTEAPEKVVPFLRQRRRWTLGMLQTSFKHRRAISEGRAIGLVSILDAIWFSLLTSILSPLVDFLLIVILIKLIVGYSLHGSASLAGFPLPVIISYFVLAAIDISNTLAAFWFEKKFDLKLLLLTPALRFGYRQLIYISSLQAMRDAITGRMPGWQKLQRSAAKLNSKIEFMAPAFNPSLSKIEVAARDTKGRAHPIVETSDSG